MREPFFERKNRNIFLYNSSNLSPKNHYTAVMMPLVIHPTNQNAIICADLSRAPSVFNHSSDEL
ncbi:MAG: hypothetical protein CBC09_05280 [Cellvibrionales bacterium TMED49]|nr:hypothetical protein [Porticoccaceae bacterium]OUU38487.1 MAG: hypothetical protein CBC09_05280 [Cellvibrionales bacterium TMED49]